MNNKNFWYNRELISLKMTEVEKDLSLLSDHRMTMNHQYDCDHEMANVMSRHIRK